MSKQLKVLNNTAAVLGGDFVYHLINFAATTLVARSLGGESYGQFSFIYVYLSFFEAFVQFGMNSVLTRELAREREDAPRILGNALLLRAALVLGSVPVAMGLIRHLGYPLTVQQGVFLASFQLFLTLRPVYESIFRARLLMIYPAALNALRALVNLAFIALVAFRRPAVPYFILAYLASGLVGFAGLAFVSRKWMKVDFRPDGKILLYLVRESTPLVLSAYLTLLYYRIDVMMLSFMRTFREVGYYSVATRLGESLNMISGALLVSFFPLFSRAFRENRSEFEAQVSQAFRWILLTGLPLVLGGVFVAKDLILLFFGPEYAPSGITFAILLGYTFFCFVGSLLANILIACGKQVADMWISAFLVLLNIGTNVLLIPHWSYNGAALATVLTEVIGVFIYFFYAAKNQEIRLRTPKKEIALALKVNLIFLMLLLLMRKFGVNALGLIFSGMALYTALLFLFRILSWKELKALASAKRPP